MSKLYFMNNGYFDSRAMMTFGVNVKQNEDSIGYFGTGFKYAVAIILRLGGKISVTSNNEEDQTELIIFTRQTETIRGKEFEMVKMNGADAGFTTRLGIDWEPWQAYRELYSNCIDECGNVSDERNNMDTVITVDCQEIYDAWHNRTQYFITGDPVYCRNGVAIYRQQQPFYYYRGIAVSNSNDSLFSYNILSHIDLTEDRTAKYTFEIHEAVRDCYQSMEDEDILTSVLGSKACYEAKIDFNIYAKPSDTFLKVASDLKKTGRRVNESVREILKKHQQRKGEYEGRPISLTDQKMIDRSKEFLSGLGINIDDFEILCVKGLGQGIMGRALKNKIYLSDLPFQLGTKQVASTLLEEWVHLSQGYDDFSRDLQNWLFDKILSIGEQINGEPL